ncbi:MAG: hypothetical protein ACI9DF_006046 [Verrucomicrobiales bacterium]|jgi:hypothetical protein
MQVSGYQILNSSTLSGSRLQGDRQSENVSKRNAVESAKQRQRVQPPGHQVTWLTEVSGESEKTEINL